MKYISPEKKQYYIRQGETLSVKEAFAKVISQSDFGRQYYRIRTVAAWKEVMGDTVARRTTRIFAKRQKLYVELNSAPLRQELQLMREPIAAKINENVGKTVVTEIVFL